jgi:hypothetical protein|nr:MAG TPA: hypothetical protein [Caudoviricetes sp.]
MSSKTNNIIIDIDYLFDKDIAILGMANYYLYEKGIIDEYIKTDTYIKNRVYNDKSVNPLLSILPDQEIAKILFSNIVIDDELEDFRVLIENNIFDMVMNYVESSYISVNFAVYNEAQKEKIIKIFGSECSFIIKDETDKINMRKYDTIYLRDYTDLKYYDFSKCERKTIYISNLRCNFIDDDKLTLRFEYLDIGMRNDVLCTDIYNNMITTEGN